MSAPKNLEDLERRTRKLPLKGVPPPLREAARRALVAWIGTARAHDMPLKEALRRLRDGEAAVAVGQAAIEPQLADPSGPAARAACRSGCAFCCVLRGDDGGTITRSEALRLHAALAPLAGEPDGRAWRADACAALDPQTLKCRAYDVRPMICRSFLSSDAAACARMADGAPATGTGVLGAQSVYLAVLAATRQLLQGVAQTPTYSLATVTAWSVDGRSDDETLTAARHAPRELDAELARTVRAIRP